MMEQLWCLPDAGLIRMQDWYGSSQSTVQLTMLLSPRRRMLSVTRKHCGPRYLGTFLRPATVVELIPDNPQLMPHPSIVKPLEEGRRQSSIKERARTDQFKLPIPAQAMPAIAI